MARPKRAVTTAKAAVAKTAEPKTTEVKATEVKEVKAEEKKVVEEKAAAKTTAKKTTRKPACKVSTCVELNGLSVSVAEVEAAVKKAVKVSGAEATDVDGAGDATNKVDLKTL